jgi:23S rRNA (uridine2552-2'-O)-methyltransferase
VSDWSSGRAGRGRTGSEDHRRRFPLPWRDGLTKRWLKEHKNDPYYKKAKSTGYRSRASFKLQQIHKRYGIIRKGNTVVDLGCAPGGWLQVAVELVGPKGKVVGVDIDKVKTIEGVLFIRGDMRDDDVFQEVVNALPKGRANVVISDMSPNISGKYSIDHARSVELAETAFSFACKVLGKGSRLVIKVFQGDMFPSFLKKVKRSFGFCKAHSPKASRKASSEIYIIGKGFRGPGTCDE